MSTVINYTAPKGAVLQHDFVVRVRACDQKEWQELSCYQIKVDMHEKRTASMAYFDFPVKWMWKLSVLLFFLFIRWMFGHCRLELLQNMIQKQYDLN